VSRPSGISPRSIEVYNYTLKGFIGKPVIAQAGNGLVREWFTEHDSFELNKGGAQTMLKRLAAEIGIHCNAHAFRRGFAVYQIKSGLSTMVVQALSGWETIAMVERYSKSLTFDDASSIYKAVNSDGDVDL
jgi:integrase